MITTINPVKMGHYTELQFFFYDEKFESSFLSTFKYEIQYH